MGFPLHSVLLVDGSGTPIQVNLFEAFGGIERSWGDSENNRLANTKERDASIGLDNHGFRYFDPSIGRYISNDPISYEGGFNLYVYCTNDPVNKFDPHGLADEPVWYSEAFQEQQEAQTRIAQGARHSQPEVKPVAPKPAEVKPVRSPDELAMNDYYERQGALYEDNRNGKVKYNGHMPDGSYTYLPAAAGMVNEEQARTNTQLGEFSMMSGAYAKNMTGETPRAPETVKDRLKTTQEGTGTTPETGNAGSGVRPAAQPEGSGSEPVKPGDRGAYTELKAQKAANGQTEPVQMHEMPSFAAKVEAFKKANNGRDPTPAELKQIRDQGVSEAVTPAVHKETDTYGGKNTKEKQQKDAADLLTAN